MTHLIQLRILGLLWKSLVDDIEVYVVSSKEVGGGKNITWVALRQKSEYFSGKDCIVNILGFMDAMVSVATTQLCYCGVKVAMNWQEAFKQNFMCTKNSISCNFHMS